MNDIELKLNQAELKMILIVVGRFVASYENATPEEIQQLNAPDIDTYYKAGKSIIDKFQTTKAYEADVDDNETVWSLCFNSAEINILSRLFNRDLKEKTQAIEYVSSLSAEGREEFYKKSNGNEDSIRLYLDITKGLFSKIEALVKEYLTEEE